MIKQHLLPNGIRLIYEKMEHVRSVSMGVWVDTGSVRETQETAGASHLIEHMVFKGTERRDAEQIAIEMDAVGGNINAFTSKENEIVNGVGNLFCKEFHFDIAFIGFEKREIFFG